MASSARSLFELVRDDLRLHRRVGRGCRARPSARATPACRPAPSPGSARSCWRSSSGSSARSTRAAVADQADVDRVAQADARGVEVDLHARGLAGLRVELDVGEARCRRSAACRSSPSRPATARVPSRPMPPVVYGLSSGTAALPSSALTIGAPSRSAIAASSSRAPSAPRPARIATFLPAFRIVGRAARARSSVGSARSSAIRRPRCGPGCCASSAGRVATVLLLDVDRDGDVRDAAVGRAPCGRRARPRSRRGPAP